MTKMMRANGFTLTTAISVIILRLNGMSTLSMINDIKALEFILRSVGSALQYDIDQALTKLNVCVIRYVIKAEGNKLTIEVEVDSAKRHQGS